MDTEITRPPPLKQPLKGLNLYAGLGGNRKLWSGIKITAVELEPKIASVYQRLYPDDIVIVGDAHAFLLEHWHEFDFIWSSPPCQSHSRMAIATRHKLKRYIDISLYQEIIFLKTYASIPFVVENVVPYYDPLIKPTQIVGRHLFWSNFKFEAEDVQTPPNFINQCNLAGKQALMDWLGIFYEENIYYGKNHCPAQILRNCVHPRVGEQIFNAAKSYLAQSVKNS
jgi:DNA (cytosine-5)-methyltransferase 1